MEQGLAIGEMQGGGRGLEGGLWMAAGGEGSVVVWGFLGRGHPSQTRAGGVPWCPTEGFAKCGYKKAFVNVRSPLMGGGSGLCQLLFVQRRKQRGCLPASTRLAPRALEMEPPDTGRAEVGLVAQVGDLAPSSFLSPLLGYLLSLLEGSAGIV